MDFVKSIEKLYFWGVKGTDGTVTYTRMQGFDELSKSLNPSEYSRKYVDEEFERTDVTGYSPSLSFSFDDIKDNAIHDDIANMADNEVIGSEAVRCIVQVDLSTESKTKGTYKAVKRDFATILDTEDNSDRFYKYTGTLKIAGDKVFGTATTDDGWQTLTFTESE